MSESASVYSCVRSTGLVNKPWNSEIFDAGRSLDTTCTRTLHQQVALEWVCVVFSDELIWHRPCVLWVVLECGGMSWTDARRT